MGGREFHSFGGVDSAVLNSEWENLYQISQIFPRMVAPHSDVLTFYLRKKKKKKPMDV